MKERKRVSEGHDEYMNHWCVKVTKYERAKDKMKKIKKRKEEDEEEQDERNKNAKK